MVLYYHLIIKYDRINKVNYKAHFILTQLISSNIISTVVFTELYYVQCVGSALDFFALKLCNPICYWNTFGCFLTFLLSGVKGFIC